MNSRGMLLVEETLKIIISVIAIGFLIYFLVSIYFSKIQGDEIIQAQADINKLNIAIRAGTASEILNNPVGWNVFSFVGAQIPDACAKEKCLCICKKNLFDVNIFGLYDNTQFKECNEDGACVAVKGLENLKNPIEIKQVTTILISKEDGKVVIGE